jgi:hypothetical protein
VLRRATKENKMKVRLTQDVKLVDGSMLYQGAEFDVLENEKGEPRHGPYIEDCPRFVYVSVLGKELAFFNPEFELVPSRNK